MTQQLVITEDGSSSIFIAELDEHYHSIHGAIQESNHVFIQAGLFQKLKQQKEISILEIGFGTGLNTLLTCIESEQHQQKINYTAIEKFPLQENIYQQLNFCSLLDEPNCANFFNSIHATSWESNNQISTNFNLIKLQQNIEDIKFENQFDIIYFDAFAPSAQPELWTSEVFDSMFKSLKNNGILVTYCAKGVVKRTLKSVGFKVEALPGPIGKREMTRAIKQLDL